MMRPPIGILRSSKIYDVKFLTSILAPKSSKLSRTPPNYSFKERT